MNKITEELVLITANENNNNNNDRRWFCLASVHTSIKGHFIVDLTVRQIDHLYGQTRLSATGKCPKS